MTSRRAAPAAFLATALVAGCGGSPAFAPDIAALPVDRAAAAAPWPRLVDMPDIAAPAPRDPPDPETGAAVVEALRAEAARMRARAEALAAPVLTPADRRRLSPARR